MEIRITGDITSLMIDGEECIIKQADLLTLADVFYHYDGTREYDGIVAVIQRWYYGFLIKEPWCATSLCWALAQLGLREYTLKGKMENVYFLNKALHEAVMDKRCESVTSEELQYGDIVILNFSSIFSSTASKHVTVFDRWETTEKFAGIGGNQDDSICVKAYSKNNIYACYRPHYFKGTLKKLGDLPDA